MIGWFKEGGWGMYPVLVIGLVLVASAGRYALDREPVRMRFVTVLSLALLAFTSLAMLTDAAMVMWAVSDDAAMSGEDRLRILLMGLKESTRPGALGLGLLSLSLALVAVGVYQTGLRELRALRG